MFRVGARPAHDKLFAGEELADLGPLQGVPRTAEEVDTICTRIAGAVDELGGKVCTASMPSTL